MRPIDRIPVLLYHRIARPENDWEARLCVEPSLFKAQMRHLAANGMRACTIDAFIGWLQESCSLPVGSFLLTFDDGFRDVYENAFPILNELGWTATVFLVSTQIGKWDSWCQHENPGGKMHALMNLSQIREMQARGFSFQSHTRTHPFLTKLADDELEGELLGARRELEDLLGLPVPAIAYPYGRVDHRVIAATSSVGYEAAFVCKPGLNYPGIDPFRLRRVEVYGTDHPKDLVRKIRSGSNVGSVRQALRYYPAKIAEKIVIKIFG